MAAGAVRLHARHNWTCLVDAGGNVEEYEDRAGVELARSLPRLVDYARAFVEAGRDRLVFHWVPSASDDWFCVTLRREQAAPETGQAIVELELVKPPFQLTPRELDILTLVAAGLANENVAARLEISVRTVAKHVENIFRKTDIWSRAGLAGLAVDDGLMRLPVPGGSDGFPLAIGQIERLADAPPALESKTRKRLIQARPFLIGIPHVTGGRGLADSTEMLNGADLAVAEINARGGLLGRRVELVRAPHAPDDPTSIVEAYQALVEEEVDAVSAGYACYHPRAHDILGEYGAPLLHAATMRCAVDRVKDSRTRLGNIFQTCASDVNYGLGLSRFVTQMLAQGAWRPQRGRLAVVQPPWPGLDIGLQTIDEGLGAQGWQIEMIMQSDGPAGWHETLRKLHSLQPSIIVLASYFVEDAIAFQRAFLSDPLPALVYAIYSPSVPKFRAELGHMAEGMIWATTTGLYSDAIGDGFRRRYSQRFGMLPGLSQAGIAYDRVNMLAGAWSRVGSSRRFGAVVDDLRSSISRGVNGAYYLGSEGQVGLAFPDDTADPSISQAHLVFQVQGNRDVIIDPSPYAHGRFIAPNWLRR
jgi:branched-chain amino acid transport system substrate-binding protein